MKAWHKNRVRIERNRSLTTKNTTSYTIVKSQVPNTSDNTRKMNVAMVVVFG